MREPPGAASFQNPGKEVTALRSADGEADRSVQQVTNQLASVREELN